MCSGTCREIVSEVKVVATLQSTTVNNGLTLLNGLLQLGGALVKNTEIIGAFTLDLGSTSNRLQQLNLRATNRVLNEFNNGIVTNSLLIDSGGITITDGTVSPRGIKGAANYSANYQANDYVQKIYVDAKIVSKNISAILGTPGAGQTGYSITWDNAANNFTLSPTTAFTVGATTQAIFNDGGSLAGSANYLFDKTFSGNLGKLKINFLELGISTSPETVHIITANGNLTDVSLSLKPKANGNILLDYTTSALVQLGSDAGTIRILRAGGSGGQVDISLEAKGTEGVIYIGNITEAGGNRYIGTRGSVTNINLELRPKGTGEVRVGNNAVAATHSILRASSSSANTILRLAAKSGTYVDVDGTAGTVTIGGVTAAELRMGSNSDAGTTRIIGVLGSQSNIDLFIGGKGTGRVWINDETFKDLPLGNWNMDITGGIAIAHGLGGSWATRISHIQVLIRDNSNALISDLFLRPTGADYTPTGSWDADATNINLFRRTGGFYDGAAYNGTGFSRGTIRIWYKI